MRIPDSSAHRKPAHMIRSRFSFAAALALLLAAALGPAPADGAAAQVLGGFRSAAGLSVTPAFEGWYRNPDGTFSLSFGYFNRNFEEVVEIPAGPANRIEPAAFDGGQPTVFHPRQHWGVFAVKVPADFGDGEVVWTIDFRGERYSIPGSLHSDWEIDALQGEAGSGNTPPKLAFSEGGPEGAGPGGVTSGPLEARVGEPLRLTVWARDDGTAVSSPLHRGAAGTPVSLTWFKHRGPGAVEFGGNGGEVPVEGGAMTVTATFSEPGEYVLRVRANDASGVSPAGHAQCCWTNGFARVTVSR